MVPCFFVAIAKLGFHRGRRCSLPVGGSGSGLESIVRLGDHGSAADAFSWINVRIVENPWFTRPVPLWLGTANQRVVTMATQMTKSQLIEQIATKNELGKKDVKGVMETLAMIGYKELKKNGVFVVPGFAKFVVIKKPATKARNGTNPFTGEPTIFKAKPARKIVRARPVKAAKDAV